MRPEIPRGTRIVVLPPLAGPAMATSGAGDGGFAPAGHGVNAPAALTYPSRPVLRFVPSTYTYTGSARPLEFVMVNGSRSGPTACAAGAAANSADAARTSAPSTPDNLAPIDLLLCLKRSACADQGVRARVAPGSHLPGAGVPMGQLCRVHFCALVPLQSQICTCVPAAVDAFGSSRQRLDWGFR